MARPQEFDASIARDAALRLFWKQGYQATSLSELTEAMGISRSSFYASFVDKRGLFRDCLDLFAERTLAWMTQASGTQGPLQSLERFFLLDPAPRAPGEPGWGCLLVNTTLEMASVDEALCAHASDHLTRIEQQMARTLREAGYDPKTADDYAGLLMLLLSGVRVAARRTTTPETQHQQIAAAFRLLETAPNRPNAHERPS